MDGRKCMVDGRLVENMKWKDEREKKSIKFASNEEWNITKRFHKSLIQKIAAAASEQSVIKYRFFFGCGSRADEFYHTNPFCTSAEVTNASCIRCKNQTLEPTKTIFNSSICSTESIQYDSMRGWKCNRECRVQTRWHSNEHVFLFVIDNQTTELGFTYLHIVRALV